MSLLHPQARSIATAYLGQDTVIDQLGSGIDGIVYTSSRATAIKVHSSDSAYRREISVYRRLREHGVHSINGFAVPQLIAYSDEHRVVEISIVQPPFVLDFAQSTLDQPPDFSEEVMEQWFNDMEEAFGDRWPVAAEIYDEFKNRYGIYHLDLKPRNVHFATEYQSKSN